MSEFPSAEGARRARLDGRSIDSPRPVDGDRRGDRDPSGRSDAAVERRATEQGGTGSRRDLSDPCELPFLDAGAASLAEVSGPPSGRITVTTEAGFWAVTWRYSTSTNRPGLRSPTPKRGPFSADFDFPARDLDLAASDVESSSSRASSGVAAPLLVSSVGERNRVSTRVSGPTSTMTVVSGETGCPLVATEFLPFLGVLPGRLA